MKGKTDYGEFKFGEGLDNLKSCSKTDCTGSLPRAPQSEEELESYLEVYDFEPPEVPVKGRD